jgi:predicted TIM-barrel fold metal-dependent hydrolase
VARPPDAIDVHAHFFPESFLDLITREGAPFHRAYPDRFVGCATLPTKGDMRPARPREIVTRGLRLSARDRSRILTENARRLLHL